MTKDQLLKQADSLEAHAKASIEAWVILGWYDRYATYIIQAAQLRHAATLKVAERNQYIKDNNLFF